MRGLESSAAETTGGGAAGSNRGRAEMGTWSSSLVAVLALFAAGCPAGADEVRPPPDQLYFPTGMVLSPDQSQLYVINANSDLRFDSGTMVTIDVAAVAEVVDAWSGGTGDNPRGAAACAPDLGFPVTLICSEREFIDSDKSIRIGNFATALDVQLLDSGDVRLFAAVRGDPSLTYIDVPAATGRPSCSASTDVFSECDDDHRLTRVGSDGIISIPDEPFGLFVDGANGYAVVTHLSNGAVSLAETPTDGSPPLLTDAIGGLFLPDSQTGARGAVGAAGRSPGSPDDRIYITSRTESRVQTLLVARNGGPPTLIPAEYFFLNRVLPSTDSRDIAFGEGGDRAYIINRNPPMLQIVDTSLSDTGIPKNEFDGAVEICRQSSSIAVTQVGGRERLYIACFQDGQVWAVNPVARVVESIIDAGRGPQYVAAAEDYGLLFVSNFREHTVAVIDIRPGSPTEDRVVLRIGRPNETEGI